MKLSDSTKQRDYDIWLESGALARAGEFFNLKRQVMIVTDDGVPAEYCRLLASQCEKPFIHRFAQGEASKNLSTWSAILTAMLAADFTRRDCVVAVGGGVAGDMAGFAAACYMRGIEFYIVPTTLLAQVDASIGGKTAIDFENVKNIVGAFYQPSAVLIDPDTLATLDERQLRAGLAEAAKMALTGDAELFSLIENSTDLTQDLPEIIRRSLLFKKAVVEQDTEETGLRRVLNFGHSLGHAIESAEEGKLLHGECVAMGLLPMCSEEVLARVIPVWKRYELDTEIPQSPLRLLPYLMHDKKRLDSRIIEVYCDHVGSFRFEEVTPAAILKDLENYHEKQLWQ